MCKTTTFVFYILFSCVHTLTLMFPTMFKPQVISVIGKEANKTELHMNKTLKHDLWVTSDWFCWWCSPHVKGLWLWDHLCLSISLAQVFSWPQTAGHVFKLRSTLTCLCSKINVLSSFSQKSPSLHRNSRQWRWTLQITAAVRLINRTEDKSQKLKSNSSRASQPWAVAVAMIPALEREPKSGRNYIDCVF